MFKPHHDEHRSIRWQAGTAFFLALGMTGLSATPLMAAMPWGERQPLQMAQVFGQPQAVVPAGEYIPVTYSEAERIVLAPDETMELTLTIPQHIRSNTGTILIAAGSQVLGQLEPVSTGGVQFVARELILSNGRRLYMEAVSENVTRTERVDRGISGNSVWKGAAVGAGAATIISAITGDRAIATEEILGGAGLGALAGVLLGRRRADVVVVEPDLDLGLTLTSDLYLR
ncbi:hypothetical protein H6G20_02390 [Desertifilum sp. FACHB-1129]|uniref:Conjugal transfer protein TrbI n=1 Tax=Desertifilum tharense IPPAS B-1220 TaxID=1781255 RepID=A0A1E5QDZ3_9CYAN|nr:MULTISPECIES: hypothetical protein [Desertifilum]MCD8487165.1 hypothetical protein [Desertifilum sp.]MDA0209042.1 hypothetical protein [Cyanobacteria bacterium FC1]MBD2310524.1 hypothetical protein [Desertifilum sp. FACHB-1129]MBD2321976.1 hypothetical protein [Desertifilum sp. FACHB-866]MBD2332103.1 hypothetical protein [Desertifilum sp. FACHB-868]